MRQVLARFIPCLCVVFIVHLSGWVLSAEEKLKPEDVVAKHLEALGTPEARAAVKTRVMSGDTLVRFIQGATGRREGKARFVSDGARVKLELRYGHPEYEAEQLVFDGKRTMVGNASPGAKSTLGFFINDHGSELLKEGILGGATNVGWALASGRKLNLSYRGLKQLQGKKVHILRYRSKQGSLRIDLGFDPETFRHVVSEYYLEMPVDQAAGEMEAAGQRAKYWRVSEEFGDFRQAEGITLPYSYMLRVQYDGVVGRLTEWSAQFSEVKQNQELSEDVFKLR